MWLLGVLRAQLTLASAPTSAEAAVLEHGRVHGLLAPPWVRWWHSCVEIHCVKLGGQNHLRLTTSRQHEISVGKFEDSRQ